jgi:hypothetical protein
MYVFNTYGKMYDQKNLCLHSASARFSAIGSALGGFDGAFATFHAVAFWSGLLTAKGTAGA